MFLSFSHHTIYHDGVGGNERDERLREKSRFRWSITQGAGSDGGAALHWRQLHFLGERGTAPLEESAGVSLLCPIRFPGLGAIASPGSIGLRQASSHRLPLKVFPMYVNLGPRFRTVGAEVASVVIIEHHYTAFS